MRLIARSLPERAVQRQSHISSQRAGCLGPDCLQMEPSVHVSRSDFLRPSQLEMSELFPKVRRSLRTGSHPSVTLTGQTPRWLEEMPRHHLRKTNQHCLDDCSRKLEGDRQLCWPRPPREKRAQGSACSRRPQVGAAERDLRPAAAEGAQRCQVNRRVRVRTIQTSHVPTDVLFFVTHQISLLLLAAKRAMAMP